MEHSDTDQNSDSFKNISDPLEEKRLKWNKYATQKMELDKTMG